MLFAPRVTASRKLAFVLPWLVVLAVAGASLWPGGLWPRLTRPVEPHVASQDPAWRELVVGRHRADVLSTLDGDTFVARIHLTSGSVATRVRLRSVDTPEMSAGCLAERRLAERASSALRALLRQGGVTVFNVGADRYAGRIVADVATREVADVSQALIRAGHGRPYAGGHRAGWC